MPTQLDVSTLCRRIVSYTVFCCIVAAPACNRDDTPKPMPLNPPIGVGSWVYSTTGMSADVNGVHWQTDSSAGAQILWEKDTSVIDVYGYKDHGYYCLEFGIHFSNIPIKLGRHFLQPRLGDREKLQTATFYGNSDCDAGCDVFDILVSDSANNWIGFTSESNNFKEFSGEFSASFIRTEGCSKTLFPNDTLRVTNGRFHMTRP